jgi:hypothetical protein
LQVKAVAEQQKALTIYSSKQFCPDAPAGEIRQRGRHPHPVATLLAWALGLALLLLLFLPPPLLLLLFQSLFLLCPLLLCNALLLLLDGLQH